MLYRTHHHPFLFPLSPFTSSSSLSPPPPPPPPLSLSPSPPTLLQEAVVVGQEGMECVEGALKSSFRPDTKISHFPQHLHHYQPLAFSGDLSSAVNINNGQNGAVGDDFFVDDLLDFSNAPSSDGPDELIKPLDEFDKNDSASSAAAATANTTVTAESNVILSPKHEFESLSDSGLGVPADDVESLEWLSQFVDDSFSEYSLTCPVSKLQPEPTKVRSEPELRVVETKPPFTTPVQTKARTKRGRSGGRVWSLGSPSLTESSSSSTSSSSTTTSSSSPPPPCNPLGAYSSPSQCQTQTSESLLEKPPAKKQKKKLVITESSAGGGAAGGGGAGCGGAQQPRRCSHCGVQKTPQWRAGPLGAKTLCNACGVRYKSGRLLPEYRPACSPTFSSELHSNNHRKVLEMRRKKEVETGLTPPPVQSF